MNYDLLWVLLAALAGGVLALWLHLRRKRAAAAQAARLEVQRRAAQELAQRQARQAAREAARIEAERRAALEAARVEAERQAALEAARLETERQAALETARVEAEQQAALEAARLEAERATPRTPEQTMVMVADDSKIVRIKTGRLLAQHQYQVAFATDGLDAAQQIEASMPHVLITDVEMPGMDGFELTRRVRANPRTAHIPVIMITAADERHRADAARAGVNVLLGKPYPDEQLIAHVASTLANAVA
jgi:CheY-like chemotaxis protein